MELRLPRRPRRFAAHQPARDTAPVAPEDDPWAGEDEAWTTDERIAAEGRGDAVRFFRGVAFGALVGVVLWALVALALFLLLG